jgi:hypothetical protein
MPLAILGTGLVSPFGLTPRDHAFFLRALLPEPSGSPFKGADDKPVSAHYCRWLGAGGKVADRLIALAVTAADEALRPLAERGAAPRLGLMLTTDTPRPGLDKGDLKALEQALSKRLSPAWSARSWGGAGVFEALANATSREGDADAILVLAVDSFISLEWATHVATNKPTRWMKWPPPPSEAAAALLVVDAARASRLGVAPCGSIERSLSFMGAANDDNDDPADGSALSAAIRGAAGPRVHYVFGQGIVDALRGREWLLAMARTSERFRAGHDEICLEDAIGSLGGASGAASLVYGLSVLRHRTSTSPWPRGQPFLAWAMSRDGRRGLASARIDEG